MLGRRRSSALSDSDDDDESSISLTALAELKFKENELQRAVRLKSVSHFNAGWLRAIRAAASSGKAASSGSDAGLRSTTAGRRPEAMLAAADYDSSAAVLLAGADGDKWRDAAGRSGYSGGSGDRNGVLGRGAGRGRSSTSSTAAGADAAARSGAWFDKLAMGYGVTDAESSIVQSSVLSEETRLMRVWAAEAQALVSLRADESRMRNRRDDGTLRSKLVELHRDAAEMMMPVDAVAAVINVKERSRLMHQAKTERIRGEQSLLSVLRSKRAALTDELLARCEARKLEVTRTFNEGPSLLRKFGSLLHSVCASIQSGSASLLLSRLREEGLDVGRVKTTDASNRRHRKITLSPVARSSSIVLTNGDFTAINMTPPSATPTWATVQATEGPWPVRRWDRTLVKQMVEEAEENGSKAEPTDVLRLLAEVLLAVHPGDDSLAAVAEATPSRAEAEAEAAGGPALPDDLGNTTLELALDERLHALGYAPAESLVRLAARRGVGALRKVAHGMLKSINARLDYHARFYFEVHVPLLPAGKPASAVVGWTWEPLREQAFPGCDAYSVGFDWTGQMWYKGKPQSYTQLPLAEASSVGFMADLVTGNLSLYINGIHQGIAFGLDAPLISPDEARRRGEIVRSEHLVPMFALMGLHAREGAAAASATAPVEVGACPQLSVNFGGFSFQHMPEGCSSCDAYLTLVPRIDWHQWEAREEKEEEKRADQRRVAARRMDELSAKHSGEIMRFMTRMGDGQARSWCRFPAVTEEERAALCLQRTVRRFLGRRARKRMAFRTAAAVMILQLRVRNWLPKIRARNRRAATMLQRYFRGFYVRKYKFYVLRYSQSPFTLQAAAIKIQSVVRMMLARKSAFSRAKRLQAVIFRLLEAVMIIENAWWNYKQFGPKQLRMARLRSVRLLQRWWRGFSARSGFGREHPVAYARMRKLGELLMATQRQVKSVMLLQRAWRRMKARRRARLARVVRHRSAALIQRSWRKHRSSKLV